MNGERTFGSVSVRRGSSRASVNIASAITKVPGEGERRSTTTSGTSEGDRSADGTRSRTSYTIGKGTTVDGDGQGGTSLDYMRNGGVRRLSRSNRDSVRSHGGVSVDYRSHIAVRRSCWRTITEIPDILETVRTEGNGIVSGVRREGCKVNRLAGIDSGCITAHVNIVGAWSTSYGDQEVD